jgi:hypothetical protein
LIGKFPGRFGAEKAVKAFEALGIEADMYPAEDDFYYNEPNDFDCGWCAGRESMFWEIAHNVQQAKALLLHAEAIANS